MEAVYVLAVPLGAEDATCDVVSRPGLGAAVDGGLTKYT